MFSARPTFPHANKIITNKTQTLVPKQEKNTGAETRV